MSIERARRTDAATCGGCAARWSGTAKAHCAAGCHLTFSSVRNFDKHRKDGRCQRPIKVGLEFNPGRGCWQRPGPAPGSTVFERGA